MTVIVCRCLEEKRRFGNYIQFICNVEEFQKKIKNKKLWMKNVSFSDLQLIRSAIDIYFIYLY